MFKKFKYFTVFLVSIYIIIYGFIKVSSGLPQFIKDRSPINVSYNKNPFDLEFDIGDYVVYINSKVMLNIKESTSKVFTNLTRAF